MSGLFSGTHVSVEQSRSLYRLIYLQPGITRQALSDRLAWPATTLNRALDRLLAASLIVASGLAASSGGRRPSLFQVVADARLLGGIELAGSDSRFVLTDLQLGILFERNIAPLTGLPLADWPVWLGEQISQACRQLERQTSDLLGIGLTGSAAQGLDQLADQLQAILTVPVQTIETLTAAAFAATMQVRGIPGQRIQYWSLGDTLQLNMTVGPDLLAGWQTIPVACLQVPGLEDDRPLPLTAAVTQSGLLKHFQTLKNDPDLTWADFSAALDQGKRKASQVLQYAGRSLALAVYNVAVVTGASQVVLGGPQASQWPRLITVASRLTERLGEQAGQPIPVRIDGLGAAGTALGAAARLLAGSLGQD